MNNENDHIELAIAELERARKFIGKIPVPQVRNGEQRFFKSYRLQLVSGPSSRFGWHTRPKDNSAAIDEPYRDILGSTDKSSAKGTYISAIRRAKNALVVARNDALVMVALARTGDMAPDFTPLAPDPQMQAILARRWDECTRCLQAGPL